MTRRLWVSLPYIYIRLSILLLLLLVVNEDDGSLDDDGVDGGLRGLGLIIIANPLDPEPKR